MTDHGGADCINHDSDTTHWINYEDIDRINQNDKGADWINHDGKDVDWRLIMVVRVQMVKIDHDCTDWGSIMMARAYIGSITMVQIDGYDHNIDHEIAVSVTHRLDQSTMMRMGSIMIDLTCAIMIDLHLYLYHHDP